MDVDRHAVSKIQDLHKRLRRLHSIETSAAGGSVPPGGSVVVPPPPIPPTPDPLPDPTWEGISDGATVSGTIYVQYTADSSNTASVEFLLDSITVNTDSAAPYYLASSAGYDTTALADGSHILDANITDLESNVTAAAQVGFTVDNSEPPPATGQIRAIWVQGTTMNSASTMRAEFTRLKAGGFNTMMILVGSGTAAWKSDLLPRESFVSSFDMLQNAVTIGHSLDLEVWAWVACGPAAKSSAFRALYPTYSVAGKTIGGQAVPSTAHWLDWRMSEVRTLYANIVKEIAGKYAVDAINLDYIRYPYPAEMGGFDIQTCLSGASPVTANDVPNAVSAMYTALEATHPTTLLTAAVFTGQGGQHNVIQYWETWLDGEYIDYVLPMCYYCTAHNSSVSKYAAEWAALAHPERIIPGMSGQYCMTHSSKVMKTGDQLTAQFDICKAKGFENIGLFDNGEVTADQLAKLADY